MTLSAAQIRGVGRSRQQRGFAAPIGRLLIAGAVLFAMAAPASADELLLRDGGRVEGKWLNPEQPRPSVYRFLTDFGARVSFAAAEVRSARITSETEREYLRRAAACEETPDTLWAFAEWCREQGLKRERRVQLKRILGLSPDHVLARRGLGYAQVDGRWVTQASYFRNEGYVMYQGRWLSPQEVELLKERDDLRRRQKTWYARLKRSRKLLAAGPNVDAARVFQDLREPEAVWGLMELWSNEPSPWARRTYAEALRRIPSPDAIAGLVRIALHDPDHDVFLECMKRLRDNPPAEVIDAFVKGLRSRNNVQVNRAAQALSQFRDPTTVEPLIGALITTHHFVVGSGSKDKMSSTFMRDSLGGSGSSFNTGDDRKLIRRSVSNQDVLSALVAITGQSFGFNKRHWSAWWDNQQMQGSGQLRTSQ